MKSFRATGSLKPKPSGGRRHAKLDPQRAFLIARIEEKADITMPELAAELAAATGTRADPASLSRWLIHTGYRFKKTLLASEQDRPDIKAAREDWTITRQPRMRLEPHRLIFIFLGETGTTTKMTRLRGLLAGSAASREGALRAWDDPDLHRRPALRQAHRPLRHQCPMNRCIFETYVEKDSRQLSPKAMS